jgi:hypothetical protein
MDIPERKVFLVGFGWAGLVSLLTYVIPVVAGGPLDANLIDLGFGVLITAAVGHAAYTGTREEPSTLSVAFAVFAAFFATTQFLAIAF